MGRNPLNIKEEHDISEVSYRTWLLPLIPDSVDKDILTILVPVLPSSAM